MVDGLHRPKRPNEPALLALDAMFALCVRLAKRGLFALEDFHAMRDFAWPQGSTPADDAIRLWWGEWGAEFEKLIANPPDDWPSAAPYEG